LFLNVLLLGSSVPGSTPARRCVAPTLAGTLAFDAAAAGGAQVAIEFDPPLVKEMARAR